MADEKKVVADPAGLARTQIAADSISRTLVKQREQLHKDLAAHDVDLQNLAQRRAQLDAEWVALRQQQAEHRDTLLRYEQTLDELATHELAVNQFKRELNARELRLSDRETKLAELETAYDKKNGALSDRQGRIEAGEKDLAERREQNRVGMHMLKAIVEEYFSGSGK